MKKELEQTVGQLPVFLVLILSRFSTEIFQRLNQNTQFIPVGTCQHIALLKPECSNRGVAQNPVNHQRSFHAESGGTGQQFRLDIGVNQKAVARFQQIHAVVQTDRKRAIPDHFHRKKRGVAPAVVHILQTMMFIQNHRVERLARSPFKKKRIRLHYAEVAAEIDFHSVRELLLKRKAVFLKNPSVLKRFHRNVDFSYIFVYFLCII